MAKFPFLHAPLLHAISSSALPTLRDIASELGILSWAVAARPFDHRPLRDALASESLNTRSHGDLLPPNLCNPAWAFASRSLPPSPLSNSIAASSLRRLTQSVPQELANIAWAVSTLTLPHSRPLFNSIASSALPLLSEFWPQHLKNTSWSCSVMHFAPVPLLHALASSARAPISEFWAQHLANSAWSESVLKFPHMPLRNALSAASLPKISQDLGTATYALHIVWAHIFSTVLPQHVREPSRFLARLRPPANDDKCRPPVSCPLVLPATCIQAAAGRLLDGGLQRTAAPHVVLVAPGVVALYKPFAWEVERRGIEDTAYGLLSGTKLITQFLRAALHDNSRTASSSGFAFGSRLDIAGSGIVAAAVGETRPLLAYTLQNYAYRISRCYHAAGHGTTSPSSVATAVVSRHINLNEQTYAAANHGKLARTAFRPVVQCSRAPRGARSGWRAALWW